MLKKIIDDRLILCKGENCYYIETVNYTISIYECQVVKITPKRTKVIVKNGQGNKIEFISKRKDSATHIHYEAYSDSRNIKLLSEPNDLYDSIKTITNTIQKRLKNNAMNIAKSMIIEQNYNLKYGIFRYTEDELKKLTKRIAELIDDREVIIYHIDLNGKKWEYYPSLAMEINVE